MNMKNFPFYEIQNCIKFGIWHFKDFEFLFFIQTYSINAENKINRIQMAGKCKMKFKA